MVCGASVHHRRHLQYIYAQSFRGADHLRRILAEAQAIVNTALVATTQQPGSASRTNAKERL